MKSASVPVRWDMSRRVCDAYERMGERSSSLHGHHHYLITLVIGGKGVQILNGESIPFESGDLFVLSPIDFHENHVECDGGFDYLGVKFHYGAIDPALWELWGNDSFPMHAHLGERDAQEIRAVMERLVDECRREALEETSEMMQRALLGQLVVLVMRATPSVAGGGADNFVSRTLAYLHSSFRGSVTVADAAANAGYTPNYFNTVFKQHFGTSFGEYLKKMRLSYARNLLLSGDATLTEIALEAGFSSLSHFSRTFSAEYGSFPTEYRRINKQTK